MRNHKRQRSLLIFDDLDFLSNDMHKVLGLERNVTRNEIRKRQHKLIKMCHPDKIGNTQKSNEISAKTNDAFATLFDEEK